MEYVKLQIPMVAVNKTEKIKKKAGCCAAYHANSLEFFVNEMLFIKLSVLEKPAIPTVADEVSYKLLFIGKSGVGKSSVIAYLAGISEPSLHIHTHGIHKTNVYWPMKLKDKVIMFKLQCWEAGESGLKKYSHILPACKDKVDGVVFVFSFADSRSFNDVHQNFTKFVKNDADNVTKIVIGTRYSSVPQCNEVKPNEIEEFEYLWNVSVQKIHDNAVVETNEAYKVVSVLNLICEQAFIRDQQFQLNRV